jgi:Ca-activated chloride channel family protein
VLAFQLVKVVPAQATLKAADSVMAGAPFPVEWTGPAGQGDTIVIAAKGAANNKPGGYAYPREVTVLEAPIEPGPHEVRYMGRGAKILAAIDISVTPPVATIRAPESAMAGAPIEVNWTGPAGKNDFVIVTEKSAADNLTSGYNYTNKGSPLTVFVPDVVGPGEVRYVSGKTKTVLKRQPLDIVEPVATLSDVPATATPKSWIEFQWTGPENRRDNFTVAKPGSAGKDAVTLRRVAPGEPGKVRAPKEAGEFELRYVTASGKILARQAITIVE